MTDLADIADRDGEFLHDLAMRELAMRPRLSPTGYCHNCGEPVLEGDFFCDSDCRDDYERRERMRCGVRGRSTARVDSREPAATRD